MDNELIPICSLFTFEEKDFLVLIRGYEQFELFVFEALNDLLDCLKFPLDVDERLEFHDLNIFIEDHEYLGHSDALIRNKNLFSKAFDGLFGVWRRLLLVLIGNAHLEQVLVYCLYEHDLFNHLEVIVSLYRELRAMLDISLNLCVRNARCTYCRMLLPSFLKRKVRCWLRVIT